jgi:hypothetical protein
MAVLDFAQASQAQEFSMQAVVAVALAQTQPH